MDQILDHVLLPCLRERRASPGLRVLRVCPSSAPSLREGWIPTDPVHQNLSAGKRQHSGQHPCNSAQTFPNQLGLECEAPSAGTSL